MTKRCPFRHLKTSPEVIRLAVTKYIRFPLSLRNVGDLLHERGIDICRETVRFWWSRSGPMFVAETYEQMVAQGVQLPFFCNDVFETFDEDRTHAACRLMERIGRSGQAIYLTHHRHVVEIAKEVCDV